MWDGKFSTVLRVPSPHLPQLHIYLQYITLIFSDCGITNFLVLPESFLLLDTVTRVWICTHFAVSRVFSVRCPSFQT